VRILRQRWWKRWLRASRLRRYC